MLDKTTMPLFATGGVIQHPTLHPPEPEELVIPSKGLKGPLSYDNCKNCRSKCEHAGKDRTFLYRDKSCKVTVVTNADRIRSMTDEALAKLLLDGCRGSKCEDQPLNDFGSVNCFDCRMKWLKQSVEEL